MRLFLTIILGLMFSTCWAWGQQDSVTSATTALQGVLSTLKDSVEKLSLYNDQLAAKDNAIKGQILKLQTQLGQLRARGDDLNKKTEKLQENNPSREQQVSLMEAKSSELDDRAQKAEAGIKLIRQSLDARYQNFQKLLLQLKRLTNASPEFSQQQPPGSQAAVHFQKERLKLIKMIYESQERQGLLHESILEVQKNTPLLPAAGALARQQLLKEQIKDMEAEIAAYPSEGPSGNPGPQWDDNQLRQLEGELRSLERNYAQLKDLMEEMSKKAKNTRITASEHAEDEKLQGNIDDLNHQSQVLRTELDDLRSQMVDLDKRKSRLETMVKQLP